MGDRRCNSSRQRPRWCYRAGSRCKPCWLLGRPRYGLASYPSVSAARPKATWAVSSSWPRTQPRQRKAGPPEQREHVVVERKLFRTRLTGPHPFADICDSLVSLFPPVLVQSSYSFSTGTKSRSSQRTGKVEAKFLKIYVERWKLLTLSQAPANWEGRTVRRADVNVVVQIPYSCL